MSDDKAKPVDIEETTEGAAVDDAAAPADTLTITADPAATDTLLAGVHVEALEPEKRKKGKTTNLDVEPATPAEVEAERPLKKGEMRVTYTGTANLLEVGDLRFRPGIPVIVPKALLEELQTLPFESFVMSEE